jgi:CheY-like chemotaxis protein
MDRPDAHERWDHRTAAGTPRARPAPATVLVVEDEPAVAAAEAMILEDAGLTVAVAPDGGAALAAVERARPDLVVLDLALPGVSGFRLLQLLKADPATAAVPVLVVTALDFAEAQEVAQTGAEGFLTKPFDAPALAAGAHRLLTGGGAPT